jgi:glutathione S-transferase
VKLLQIPFSHNSIKVRRVLALKGLDYDRENVNPAIRRGLKQISGQELTPVLVDDDNVIADSTAIALYIDEAYPDPPLLPEDPDLRARCLLLEDWADAAFMALSRRVAYWTLLGANAPLGDLFFPKSPWLVRRLFGPYGAFLLRRRFGLSKEQAESDEAEARHASRLAVDELRGHDFLCGDRISLADIALAAMSAPLQIAPAISSDPAVKDLLAWSKSILEDEFTPQQVRRTMER